MAGPNLEIFKMGVYIMLPIAAMYYFGHPDFYDNYVRQLHFWPKPESQPRIVHERSEIREEVARLREERLKRRDERLRKESPSESRES